MQLVFARDNKVVLALAFVVIHRLVAAVSFAVRSETSYTAYDHYNYPTEMTIRCFAVVYVIPDT